MTRTFHHPWIHRRGKKQDKVADNLKTPSRFFPYNEAGHEAVGDLLEEVSTDSADGILTDSDYCE